MATLLLFLAVLLGIVGAILWFLASSQEKSRAETQSVPRAEASDEAAGDAFADAPSGTTDTLASPEPEPELAEDPLAAELDEDVPVVHYSETRSASAQRWVRTESEFPEDEAFDRDGVAQGHGAHRVEINDTARDKARADEAGAGEAGPAAAADVDPGVVPAEPEAAGEDTAEESVSVEPVTEEPTLGESPQAESSPGESGVTQKRKVPPKLKNRFPLGVRRERKAWAEARGWDFRKTDSYLVDEWTRGAAATGAAPRDIAAGEAYDHETLLMDIGGVNVMAMRTGGLSGVVVDMRREGMMPVASSGDLLPVTTIGDFEVLATDAGATERMLDERVTAGLEEMPADVIAAWIEGDWALAQTTRDARQETWEAMLAPLALLADAARCLPPRDAVPLRVADLDPSREIPDPEPAGASLSVVDDGPVDEFENPPVQRPETPMTLPSRKRGEARGEVEARPLGGDEVGAIADGEETPTPHLPREMEVSPALAAERARLDRQLGRR